VPHAAVHVEAVALGLARRGVGDVGVQRMPVIRSLRRAVRPLDPGTGGQIEAHDPLQFDLVDVSGTNQYKVKPLAFVSTATPPIFLVCRAALVEAVLDVDGADEPAEVAGFAGDELPHPAARSAAAVRPAAARRQPGVCFPSGSLVALLRRCS
jgi:hypothetical protein